MSASRRAALEVMLLLADADAERGDLASAVDLLECAAGIVGDLPPEYEAKRLRWAQRPEPAGVAILAA